MSVPKRKRETGAAVVRGRSGVVDVKLGYCCTGGNGCNGCLGSCGMLNFGSAKNVLSL